MKKNPLSVSTLSITFLLLIVTPYTSAQNPEPPLYTEVEFSSIVGETLINPEYTGGIATARTLLKTGLPNTKTDLEVKEIEGGWQKVIVPKSESDAQGLIVTGRRGSLKISPSKGKTPTGVDRIQPLTDLIIGFGQLNSTLLVPMTVSQPSGFGIDILNYNTSEFISGKIVAIKDNEIAVRFEDLPSTVVSRDGKIRVSLKESGDRFLNADLRAWGYNVFVPDTDIEKGSSVKAQVFGLPDDARLKFTFESLPGQTITPSSRTLTVREINSGTPLVEIVTSIPGAQPLSVLVERTD
jgi:hypothetical protein